MQQVLSPLAAERRRAGLTQAALGARAGYCRETVCAIERGDMPRLRTLLALAKALNVEPVAILPPNDETRAGRPAFRATPAESATDHESYSPS